MKPNLQERLEELKQEFESGQNMLNEIEAKRANLRETLLRISGAIQVLEEQMKSSSESQEVLSFDEAQDSGLEEEALKEETASA